MKTKILSVKEIPKNVSFNSTIQIDADDFNRFTHSFFKYPCKFIPQIPRWAINKYTKKNDLILDPFAGSGTTLVEAVLLNRKALGIDFDKFSQLLCRTKTTNLSAKQIKFIQKIRITLSKGQNLSELPDLHNIEHWFPVKIIRELRVLKYNIDSLKLKDIKVYNLLLVCFTSTIRKCCYADDTSPKPYVSKRIKKHPQEVEPTFNKILDSYIKQMILFKGKKLSSSEIIAEDARKITSNKYNNKVRLAITSPPYINAFDYVRSLRLENSWLGYYGDSNIIEIKKKQIGTETISIKEYAYIKPHFGLPRIDSLISSIYSVDKKRAFVVYKFFKDMEENIVQIQRMLSNKGHYIIVVGDSKIRGITVDTHNILIDIAKKHNFKVENVFSYIIKNRYLRIPRKGRGGLIKKDWIIDLVK